MVYYFPVPDTIRYVCKVANDCTDWFVFAWDLGQEETKTLSQTIPPFHSLKLSYKNIKSKPAVLPHICCQMGHIALEGYSSKNMVLSFLSLIMSLFWALAPPTFGGLGALWLVNFKYIIFIETWQADSPKWGASEDRYESKWSISSCQRLKWRHGEN